MPTRIDLQRYKKTYPFLRREPRNYFLTESDLANVAIHVDTASFGGTATIIYNFPVGKFGSIPTVTVTPFTGSSLSEANFNVYVDSVSSSQVVIKASNPNNNSVHIHAIEVLS